MKFAKSFFLHCTIILLVCAAMNAQQAGTLSTAGIVPQLVNFSGKATDEQGKPVAGTVGMTFSIYQEQSAGAPLWIETQNVNADARGNYTVRLGARNATGLPLDLFASGEARWLGVRVNGGEEQPRVLLLSVPYALKAADAQTLGGLPPSAFVLAAPASGDAPAGASSATSSSASPALAGSGSADYLPLWTPNGSTLGNSVLFQSGTGSTAKIGINTTTPAATLDVKGGATVRGAFNLPSVGIATATAGANSHPGRLIASSFNSTTSTPVAQTFQWQAEPAANNTSSASASLNLLFGSGASKPAETGLNIASNGQITFAKGQSFPGAITGVTAGADLTGGGTGGNVTLNLDSTKVPLLAANNVFTGTNSFAGLDVNGNVATNSILGFSNVQQYASPYLTYISAPAPQTLGFFADGSQQMTITPSGNVGIGTTAPGAGLDMAGGLTINGTGSTLFSTQYEGANSFALNVDASATGNGWTMYDYAAGAWAAGIIEGGGKVELPGTVGINNTPGGLGGYQLTVQAAYDVLPFIAMENGGGNYCDIDNNGSLSCTGSKNAIVPVDGGTRMVAMSAIESPVNWFEDAGSAKLVNGVAVVEVDPTFIQTVNTTMDYKVFPVPNGDCKGLYVTNKTATSFEVRELGGGTSSVDFDYRIMAVRKNYETVRFADHTHDLDKVKRTQERKKVMATPLDPMNKAQAVPSTIRPPQPDNHMVKATAPAIRR